jgi:hypothetical protein
MNKLVVILILAMCGIISMAFANEVSVHLSQRKVGINESFPITFSSTHNVNTPPDFTPLQTDFDIISNTHENSVSIINGKISQEVRWNVVLIGKREGNLIIPSIQFGENFSTPQAIEITQATTAKQDDDIFMETELSPKDSVYEQALLTYTVRLYCSVNMARATLSDLNINDKDAIVERLGDDSEYDYQHNNGKYYRVYQRRYAIFPQHTGELIISPLIFEGAIITGNNFFFDVHSKIKRLSSDKHTITVKPIPLPFHKNNWLAANDVILTEDWSTDPKKATLLGEPITWTLKLSVNGCLGNHIPDIAIDFPKDLKHYFDKAEVSNQITTNSLTGVKQIKVALIATKPGKIELPGIIVPWWDLKTNEIRHVELPARTLNIQDAIQISLSTPSAIEIPASALILPETEAIYQNNPPPFLWIWCLVGLTVFLVMGTIFVVYKLTRSKVEKQDSLRKVKNALKKACQNGNAKEAEIVLLAWFSQQFPQAKLLNLLSVKDSLNEEMQFAIQGLYQALYSKNKAWNGEALWKVFCNYQPHHKADAKISGKENLLPELYD